MSGDDKLGYKVMPEGQFRISLPAGRLEEFVSEIMRRKIADMVTIGSVEYEGETPVSFYIGATPSVSNKPAMETFLRKHNVPNTAAGLH